MKYSIIVSLRAVGVVPPHEVQQVYVVSAKDHEELSTVLAVQFTGTPEGLVDLLQKDIEYRAELAAARLVESARLAEEAYLRGR